jgi:hypothetical protein
VTLEKKELNPNDFSGIMLDRWTRVVSNLVETDKLDLLMESHYFGKQGMVHQQQPEFAQSVYLRIRSNEEAFAISNYLAKDSQRKKYISEYDRSYAIQKIFDLHSKKDYKVESLFTACYIMDRYLHKIGYKNFPREKICSLAVTSILMAAKLE